MSIPNLRFLRVLGWTTFTVQQVCLSWECSVAERRTTGSDRHDAHSIMPGTVYHLSTRTA